MSLDLQSLIEKLNPVCRKDLEKAAELCVSQTHYNVEIEHYLVNLIETAGTDMEKAFRHYDIRPAEITRSLQKSIEGFKRGNSRTPALSPQIIQWFEQAWLYTSIHFSEGMIRTGSLLVALLEDDALRELIVRSAPQLKRLPRASLRHDVAEIMRVSSESEEGAPQQPASQPARSEQPRGSRTPSLDQYTIDLTQRARQGLIDPIQGRDKEIRQIIDILTRRRQNNPILTGEAGVGKTAVVEGFALRISADDVPPALKNISLRLLDLGLLQAGAGIKGEFEKRLKSVIDEVKGSPKPVILFIDEAHTMIGAGAPAGMGDAANMLKPALARGELRTIAATTWSEYKKYFEKDPALARRFQVVKIDEPDEAAAVAMLRGVAANLEQHHKVRILDEALRDAVRLSQRYISGRRLPDKAVSVLDTACARVAVSQTTIPPEIEDLTRRMDQTTLEKEILTRETATGMAHYEKIAELESSLSEMVESRDRLTDQWEKEKELVGSVLELHGRIESGEPGDDGSFKKELVRLKAELFALQGKEPLVPVNVDAGIVADVISDWTGIPVGKMLTDEIDAVLTLDKGMKRRIIGQNHAVDAICRRIRTYRAGMDDPGKPVGVFLLVGPSGIGKTETAVTMAELLYGGDRNLISLNMSEYQEAYTVSGLKGSPPGYVGYGKGGVLTEAVRRNPYSVVLLDEVEKAHSDVMELFYQVFDKGTLEDSEGVVVDFKNTLILLTSNVGAEAITKACRTAPLPDPELLTELVRPHLLRHFKPAFLGRLVVVPYYPLEDGVIQEIVRLKLDKIQQRFRDNHRIELTYSESLVEIIAARCRESDTGARNVDHLLTHYLLPELSGELLRRMAAEEICTGIHVYIDDNGGFAYAFDPPSEARSEPIRVSPLNAVMPPRHLFRLGTEEDTAVDEEAPEDREVRQLEWKRKKRSRLRDLFNRL